MVDLPDPPPGLSRRGMLRTGGLTISLGAIVAACSGDEGAPGRVGNAPVVTALPTVTVDDPVLLRTASSLAYTVNDLYQRMLLRDVLDADATALLERFVADHEGTIGTLADLTTEAGGEPWECTNAWIEERVIAPLFVRIDGDADEGIEPTDDLPRDLLEVAYAFESMVGAAHQQLVEQLTSPDLRREVSIIGAQSARHSVAVAILRTGAPDAYVSPVLFGDEIDPSATDGIPPLFALTGTFGSLAPVPVFIGAANDAGGRFETTIETPADNAFVYRELSCDA